MREHANMLPRMNVHINSSMLQRDREHERNQSNTNIYVDVPVFEANAHQNAASVANSIIFLLFSGDHEARQGREAELTEVLPSKDPDVLLALIEKLVRDILQPEHLS